MLSTFSLRLFGAATKASPENRIESFLEKLEQQLAETKRYVRDALVEEKRLLQQVEAQRAQAKDWQSKAREALREGDEAQARQAVERAHVAESRADKLSKEWNSQEEALHRLKEDLVSIKEVIDRTKRNYSLFQAREASADATLSVLREFEDGALGTTKEALEDYKARSDLTVSTVEAFERSQDSVRELAQMESKHAVEQALTTLRREVAESSED